MQSWPGQLFLILPVQVSALVHVQEPCTKSHVHFTVLNSWQECAKHVFLGDDEKQKSLLGSQDMAPDFQE